MTEDERKEYARRIQENPFYHSIMAEIRAGLQLDAERAKSDDKDSHQAIILQYQLLRRIEKYIDGALNSANISQYNANQRKRVT